MNGAADPSGQPELDPPGSVKQIRLTWMSLDVWSVLKTSFLLGLASGILAVLTTLVAWTFLTEKDVLRQLGTVVAGFSTTVELNGLSALINGNYLLGICMGVGIFTVLGCTLLGVLGVLGVLAYNTAATGSIGALLIGLSSPTTLNPDTSSGSTRTNKPPNY